MQGQAAILHVVLKINLKLLKKFRYIFENYN